MDWREQRYREARQQFEERRRAREEYGLTPGLDAGRSNPLHKAYLQAENGAWISQDDWPKHQALRKQRAAAAAAAAAEAAYRQQRAREQEEYEQQRAREQEEYDLQQRRDRLQWEEAQRRLKETDQAGQRIRDLMGR